MTPPPGLSVTPPLISDATLRDVKSLSVDSVLSYDGESGPIQNEPKRALKTAIHHRERSQLTDEPGPSSSTSDQRPKSELSEQSAQPDLESVDPSTLESVEPSTYMGIFSSSSWTTVQTVREVVVDSWKRARQLKFPFRKSEPTKTDSTNPEAPPEVSKQLELIGHSSSSHAVSQNQDQIAGEGDPLLPVDEHTGGQSIETSMTNPTERASSVSSSTSSESTQSLPTVEEWITVEKPRGPEKSEKSDEFNLPKPTKSLPTTQNASSSEKIVLPHLVEDTEQISISVSLPTPTQSSSSGVFSTTKSSESSPQLSGAKIPNPSWLLPESTGAQVSDISSSSRTEMDFGLQSMESLSMASNTSTSERGIYRPLLNLATSSSSMNISSGEELDFTSQSIESLPHQPTDNQEAEEKSDSQDDESSNLEKKSHDEDGN